MRDPNERRSPRRTPRGTGSPFCRPRRLRVCSLALVGVWSVRLVCFPLRWHSVGRSPRRQLWGAFGTRVLFRGARRAEPTKWVFCIIDLTPPRAALRQLVAPKKSLASCVHRPPLRLFFGKLQNRHFVQPSRQCGSLWCRPPLPGCGCSSVVLLSS